MESQSIDIRAVIKFLTKEGAKAKEIHWCMADVYGGDSSPKYSTVAKWSAEFKRGRDSLEDDTRPGHPADVISQEMIDCVERLMLNNRIIRVAELASECGISNGSVSTIIHEHFIYCTKTTQVFFGHVFFSVTETDVTIKIYKEYSKMDWKRMKQM